MSRVTPTRKPFLHRDGWTYEQDDLLRALAGTLPPTVIALRLSALAGTERTRCAVRSRANLLGVSLWWDGYSLHDLERIFGVNRRTVQRYWIAPGYLRPLAWDQMGPYPRAVVSRAEAERFIREHGWLVDVARMDPAHPLHAYADVMLRGKYLTRSQLAAWLGFTKPSGLTHWVNRGLVPRLRRPRSGPSVGWLVRTDDAPAIRAAIVASRTRPFTATAAA